MSRRSVRTGRGRAGRLARAGRSNAVLRAEGGLGAASVAVSAAAARRPERRSSRQRCPLLAAAEQPRRVGGGFPATGPRPEIPPRHPDQQHPRRGEEHQRETLDQRIAAVDQDVFDAGDLAPWNRK